MHRLTKERANGIKTGYWSQSNKEELVQKLAEYENTGLSPERIREMEKLYLEKCEEVNELMRQPQLNIEPMFYMGLSVYFEVKDSEMYGGIGSIGYASYKLDGVRNFEALNTEMLKKIVAIYAEMLNVPMECIRVISKDEYDEMTEDDED